MENILMGLAILVLMISLFGGGALVVDGIGDYEYFHKKKEPLKIIFGIIIAISSLLGLIFVLLAVK